MKLDRLILETIAVPMRRRRYGVVTEQAITAASDEDRTGGEHSPSDEGTHQENTPPPQHEGDNKTEFKKDNAIDLIV